MWRTGSGPWVLGETRRITRMVDVLPAPFGPRKPNASPWATSKSIASTAVNVPKRLVRPRAWMSWSEDAPGDWAMGRAWYRRGPDTGCQVRRSGGRPLLDRAANAFAGRRRIVARAHPQPGGSH